MSNLVLDYLVLIGWSYLKKMKVYQYCNANIYETFNREVMFDLILQSFPCNCLASDN